MSVVDLAKLKEHLSLKGNVNDETLGEVLDSAEEMVAKVVGPLSTVSVSTRVRASSTALVLPQLPAVALTSVTPKGGAALTLGDLFLYPDAGVVAGSFSHGGDYDVVYDAGRAVVPADLLEAIRLQVMVLWQARRGGGALAGGQRGAVQADVDRLMEPHRTPGWA